MSFEPPPSFETAARPARPAVQPQSIAADEAAPIGEAAIRESDGFDGSAAAAVPAAPLPARAHAAAARAPRSVPAAIPPPGAPAHGNGAGPEGEDQSVERGATAPQLRRFIKSRAYVPMHELRRRFAINGGDDEVTGVDVDRQRVYVGLPEREGRLLGELLRGGDIGFELSMDPISPIVVGVYPMRPVTRA
jgi:hypothetical protein